LKGITPRNKENKTLENNVTIISIDSSIIETNDFIIGTRFEINGQRKVESIDDEEIILFIYSVIFDPKDVSNEIRDS